MIERDPVTGRYPIPAPRTSLRHLPTVTLEECENEPIDIIICYLNGRLSPADSATVRRRLDEDAEFYQVSENFIFAWSLPTAAGR